MQHKTYIHIWEKYICNMLVNNKNKHKIIIIAKIRGKFAYKVDKIKKKIFIFYLKNLIL